jgi:hypothetical protein
MHGENSNQGGALRWTQQQGELYEWTEPGVVGGELYAQTEQPRRERKLYAWTEHQRREGEIYSSLLYICLDKTGAEEEGLFFP